MQTNNSAPMLAETKIISTYNIVRKRKKIGKQGSMEKTFI